MNCDLGPVSRSTDTCPYPDKLRPMGDKKSVIGQLECYLTGQSFPVHLQFGKLPPIFQGGALGGGDVARGRGEEKGSKEKRIGKGIKKNRVRVAYAKAARGQGASVISDAILEDTILGWRFGALELFSSSSLTSLFL
eukprot:1383400-Amorphochlora_amoeboformis.AAC.1